MKFLFNCISSIRSLFLSVKNEVLFKLGKTSSRISFEKSSFLRFMNPLEKMIFFNSSIHLSLEILSKPSKFCLIIFFQSPIGKGLIGKNKNDLVEIKTPSGEKNFEIEDVKYL